MNFLSIMEVDTNFSRCAHCKHYGATVACKASDRVYHWPCAVASGAFLEKSTLVMVSVESYDKVRAFLFINIPISKTY